MQRCLSANLVKIHSKQNAKSRMPYSLEWKDGDCSVVIEIGGAESVN